MEISKGSDHSAEPGRERTQFSLLDMGATIGFMALVAALFFGLGVFWSQRGEAAPRVAGKAQGAPASSSSGAKKAPRVIYPKETKIDFEGMQIEGEIRNPGEFYFQHKVEEKFDSLVQRRKNFHREMLRDVVMSK